MHADTVMFGNERWNLKTQTPEKGGIKKGCSMCNVEQEMLMCYCPEGWQQMTIIYCAFQKARKKYFEIFTIKEQQMFEEIGVFNLT
jgi:hypothetical protein